jgi:hypothetical protein
MDKKQCTALLVQMKALMHTTMRFAGRPKAFNAYAID